MAATRLSHLLFSLSPLLLLPLLAPLTHAQDAPAPASPGPLNLTTILDKAGQYTMLIKLLITTTQIGMQIDNQLNNSYDGMTILAPTDNAFNTLKAGTLNSLTNQQQVQLLLYHVLPKFYKLVDLPTVSNPVRTQATGQENGVWGLNFTGQGNQVNVSSGLVETQITNPLRQEMPLAVYQLDKVLLPEELFGTKPPPASPAPSEGQKPPSASPTPPTKTPSEGTKTPSASPAPSEGTKPPSESPAPSEGIKAPSPSPAPPAKTSSEGTKPPSPSPGTPTGTSSEGTKPTVSEAKEPVASEEGTNAGGRINAGLGIVAGIALLCMGLLS